MRPPDHAWVIGGSGLLGSAIRRELAAERRPAVRLFRPSRTPWVDATAAVTSLREDLRRFLEPVRDAESWAVYWAAGAGVIGSDPADLRKETEILEGFVPHVAKLAHHGRGGFFLASSASVYAGRRGAPYDEDSPPAPTSDYARTKLANEQAVRAALAGTLPHVVGRITTLFGPGQDMSKNQGLVTKLCLQAARQQPITVFVPIDTLRDYVYVADAADAVVRLLGRAVHDEDRSTRIRNIAHGQPVSVGALCSLVRAVSHRRAGELHIPAPLAAAHVQDLRVHTRFPEETAGRRSTPMAVGVLSVYQDVLGRSISHVGR